MVDINQAIINLKELIGAYRFTDPAEEIKFFKEINPEFYALWIYYSSVYSIQSYTFPGSSKNRIKYLENETKKIDAFYAAKVFNNGDVTIEAITRYCEKIFYILRPRLIFL